MSIANKLAYLSDTKEELKEAINNIGGSITNETTFREYAQELDNIYTNLPKVEGEDTNLSLNTLKGKMGIIPKGDTEQETTTGKNLYPSGTSTQTIAGVTFTPQADGSLKLEGTSTYSNYYVAGGDSNYVEVENLSNIAETVTLSVSGMQTGIQVFVVGSTLGAKVIQNSDGNLSFTTTLNDTYRLFIRILNGSSVDTTLYIQLEKGSSATSYEMFTNGASPNPSFPQDIEVVTGTQTITISNSDNTETQTQTISLGDIELCKIGNYQDYLYKSNDKWYKKEYIGKVVLNGSENWGKSGNTNNNGFLANINDILISALKPSNNNINANVLSNCFISYSVNQLLNNGYIGIGLRSDGYIAIGTSLSGIDNVEDFKTWLSTHNVELYYNLTTPQDIEITDTTLIEQLNNLEKLMSYNGTTNISSSGNLPMVLSVSAIKGE